jgi:hypothetical protein
MAALADTSISKRTAQRMMNVLALSIRSSCIKVAEAAVTAFHTKSFDRILQKNAAVAFPSLFKAFYESCQFHASERVRDESKKGLTRLNQINSYLIADIARQYKTGNVQSEMKPWAVIVKTAGHKDRGINLAEKLGEIAKLGRLSDVRAGLKEMSYGPNSDPVRGGLPAFLK